MPDNGTVPLAILWDYIRWDKIESEVYRIQTRIVKYLKQGKLWQVKKLQRLLRHSYHAILLAIKRVTSNKGKNTAGVDGKVIRTPGQKIRIARIIKHQRRYRALPLRRILIPKKNGKMRALRIGLSLAPSGVEGKPARIGMDFADMGFPYPRYLSGVTE